MVPYNAAYIFKRYFQLPSYSQGVNTAGSSTCLIWQIYLFIYFYIGCPSWHTPKEYVSSPEIEPGTFDFTHF